MTCSRSVVLKNIRAEMARREVSNVDLARVIRRTAGAVSMKLHGQRPLTVDELEAIAEYLGVDLGLLGSPVSPAPGTEGVRRGPETTSEPGGVAAGFGPVSATDLEPLETSYIAEAAHVGGAR